MAVNKIADFRTELTHCKVFYNKQHELTFKTTELQNATWLEQVLALLFFAVGFYEGGKARLHGKKIVHHTVTLSDDRCKQLFQSLGATLDEDDSLEIRSAKILSWLMEQEREKAVQMTLHHDELMETVIQMLKTAPQSHSEGGEEIQIAKSLIQRCKEIEQELSEANALKKKQTIIPSIDERLTKELSTRDELMTLKDKAWRFVVYTQFAPASLSDAYELYDEVIKAEDELLDHYQYLKQMQPHKEMGSSYFPLILHGLKKHDQKASELLDFLIKSNLKLDSSSMPYLKGMIDLYFKNQMDDEGRLSCIRFFRAMAKTHSDEVKEFLKESVELMQRPWMHEFEGRLLHFKNDMVFPLEVARAEFGEMSPFNVLKNLLDEVQSNALEFSIEEYFVLLSASYLMAKNDKAIDHSIYQKLQSTLLYLQRQSHAHSSLVARRLEIQSLLPESREQVEEGISRNSDRIFISGDIQGIQGVILDLVRDIPKNQDKEAEIVKLQGQLLEKYSEKIAALGDFAQHEEGLKIFLKEMIAKTRPEGHLFFVLHMAKFQKLPLSVEFIGLLGTLLEEFNVEAISDEEYSLIKHSLYRGEDKESLKVKEQLLQEITAFSMKACPIDGPITAEEMAKKCMSLTLPHALTKINLPPEEEIFVKLGKIFLTNAKNGSLDLSFTGVVATIFKLERTLPIYSESSLALLKAQANIIIDPSHPLYEFQEAFNRQLGETQVATCPFAAHFSGQDTGVMKCGSFEVEEKEGFYNFSFSLSHWTMQRLRERIQAGIPGSKRRFETHEIFHGRGEYTGTSLPIADAKRDNIEFIGDLEGAIFSVGKEENYWSFYNDVKISIPISNIPGKVLSDLHQVSTLLGLGPIAGRQREEDDERIKIAVLFRTLFPVKAYRMERLEAFYTWDIKTLCQKIIAEESKMEEVLQTYLKKDLSLMQKMDTYKGKSIWAVASLPKELKKLGAMGLMSGVGQTPQHAAQAIASMLIEGQESLKGRLKRGKIIAGTVPNHTDLRYGGGDQLYTRLIHRNSPRPSHHQFSGHAQILYSLDELAGGSYAFWSQCGGCRHPTMTFNNANTRYPNRPDLLTFTEGVMPYPEGYPYECVMLKDYRSPDRIKRILVQSSDVKRMIKKELRKKNALEIRGGIEYLRDRPIDDLIVVSNSFKTRYFA